MEAPEKLQCYYAHPMSLYGSPQEDRDLATLYNLGFDVVNPNSVPHIGKSLDDFCQLATRCDVVAFRALADGSITSGVAKEIKHARMYDIPIIELPCGITRRTLTLDETLETFHDMGER